MMLFLMISACSFAQIDIAEDTLRLNEVVVRKDDSRLNLKKVQLEGPCSYPENMQDVNEIITLVDKLPKGKLHSVTFYFNKIDAETYKKNASVFKEAEFEVVLYDAGTDGMPGIAAVVDRKSVAVSKAKRGRVTVDLSLYDIDTNKQMFIGLKRISGEAGGSNFFIDCLCSGQDKFFTYTRTTPAAAWERRWSCAALKLDVRVIPNG